MVKFLISTNIDKASDVVWDAYIDPKNMLQYTKYLEKVELIEGKFGEIGAKAHLHYLEKGRSYILEDKLISYEEGKRIKSQVSGQGMIIEVETLFESIQDGTKIMLTWNGTSKSLPIRFILKIMQKKIKRHAEQELLAFKKLVEKYGVSFPDNSM
jgi:uncharacterized membrane protein